MATKTSKKTVKTVKNSKPVAAPAKKTASKPAVAKSAKKVAAKVASKPVAKKAPVGRSSNLTAEFVSKIKKLLKSGKVTQTEIAAKTKLPRSTIYNIAVGNTWKDVK